MDGIPVKSIVGAVIGVFIAIVAFANIYSVNQSERAVTFRNGAVTGVADAGLHIKVPFIDDYERVSLQNNLVRWEKLEGYSHDQQPAHYMISVNWQIRSDKVVDAQVKYGGQKGVLSRIVTPAVLKNSKIAIGTFTAQTSIQERGKLNAEVQKLIEQAVDGTPAQITAVNIEDIKFLPEYENSINARMIAEVDVQTETQKLAKEKVLAQQAVAKAQGAADATLAQKKADALGIQLVGEAQAKAIEARGKAIANNPLLIELTKSEKWNGALPTTMLPGGATPMINIK